MGSFKVSNEQHTSSNSLAPVCDAFKSNQLIWSGTQWVSTGPRVVWKDRKNIFGKMNSTSGDSFVCLECVYGREPILKDFFFNVIKIEPDASTADFLRFLVEFKNSGVGSLIVKDIYQILFVSLSIVPISPAQERKHDFPSIVSTFEAEGLFYLPSTNQWHPKKNCLWEDHTSALGHFCGYLSKVC